MLQGSVTLADFEDQAVTRPDIRELMDRIDLSEDVREQDILVGLDHGSVKSDHRIRWQADRRVGNCRLSRIALAAGDRSGDDDEDRRLPEHLSPPLQSGAGPSPEDSAPRLRVQVGMEAAYA